MKRCFVLIFAIFMLLLLSACSVEDGLGQAEQAPVLADGQAAPPLSSVELPIHTAEDAAALFREAGFTDVRQQVVYDLNHANPLSAVTLGRVGSVSVNGSTYFEKDDRFEKDAPVILFYHTYEKDDPDLVYEPYTAEALLRDLAQNPMRAKDLHLNEHVEITGKVSEIASNGRYLFLCATDDTAGEDYIYCSIDTDEQLDHVYGLSIGDTVTVRGKINVVNVIYDYAMYAYCFVS